jgi:hypothetical protein
MAKRKKVLLGILALLYGGTWFGGWTSHAESLRERADATYHDVEWRNQEAAAWAKRMGATPYQIEIHDGGPILHIDWCVPLVPGILLSHSDYSVGPLIGCGGFKIVLYYGFGSTELCMWGWIA